MADMSIKQIQITGGAEVVGGRKKRASRRSSRGLPVGPVVSKQQSGGSCGVPGYLEPMKLGTASLDHAFQTLTPPGVNPNEITKLAVSALPNKGLEGGKRKIELRASSKKSVHLHSKKPTLKVHRPHKKTRKIVLGLVSLHKRQTRAKKISQKMKEMPIDKLKQLLVEQGLIKKDSKAPESILRQIAADSQIVGGNGL
jgi:hypothetical protein